jgi:hypothetical protein
VDLERRVTERERERERERGGVAIKKTRDAKKIDRKNRAAVGTLQGRHMVKCTRNERVC